MRRKKYLVLVVYNNKEILFRTDSEMEAWLYVRIRKEQYKEGYIAVYRYRKDKPKLLHEADYYEKWGVWA